MNRRRSPDVGFQFHFGSDDVVRCTDLSHCPSLAVGLSVSRRIQAVLRRGPLTIAELAESVGAKRDTVKKALRRSRVFTAMTNAPDGVHRWALAESRTVQ